jgi:hypothetical protein
LPKIGRDGGPAKERNEATNTSLRMIATAMSATAMHIKINVLLSIVIGVYIVLQLRGLTRQLPCCSRTARSSSGCGPRVRYTWYMVLLLKCSILVPREAGTANGAVDHRVYRHTTWCVGNAVAVSVDGMETERRGTIVSVLKNRRNLKNNFFFF